MKVKYLDYVKAMGIFLVIVEHVIASYPFMQPVTVGILAFHMPLFFVISGYQYSLKEKIDGISGRFVAARAKRLLIPYAVFIGCILCYKIPFTLITTHRLSTTFIGYMAENIFVTGYGVGWFLLALFYAELLFRTAFLTQNKALHAAVAVGCCSGGLLLSFSGNVFLKLAARVLIACTFLWAGYYAGKVQSSGKLPGKLREGLPAYVHWGVFALSAALSELNGQCSMLDVRFGASRLLYLYNAIAMSLSFIGIVRRLETKALPLLGTVGIHTLGIMLTHTYVITAIKQVSYWFLPHSLPGDIASLLIQLLGTVAAELLLVYLIVKISKKRELTKVGGVNK